MNILRDLIIACLLVGALLALFHQAKTVCVRETIGSVFVIGDRCR